MPPTELTAHPLLAPGPRAAACQFPSLNEEGAAGEGEGVCLFAMAFEG